jgi:pyruvate kinase
MSLINVYADDPLTDARTTKTKIICTIGPASNNVEVLKQLMNNGMSVARLNFSHGDHSYHLESMESVREACRQTGKYCAIMMDTKGPKVRTGKLKEKAVQLEIGQRFIFTTDQSCLGDETIVCSTYTDLPSTVFPGDVILVDDGNIQFRVEEINEGEVHTVVLNRAVLKDSKGINLPGREVKLPAVSEKDIADIIFGIENGIDFISASFINRASDVELIKSIPGLRENNVKVICKIETQHGIDNFKAILAASDGCMVARGDMGVEIPIERITNVQKMIIKECNIAGKPVITATQMLESMINNPRPTRAEVSDVANAVYDGTDCVMLSGETAAGKYPVEAVSIMRKICRETEKTLSYRNIYTSLRKMVHQMKEWTTVPTSITESVASSAVKTAWDLNASLLIAITESGQTARLLAKYRPHIAILCITHNQRTARQALMGRGVIPFVVDDLRSQHNQEQIQIAINWAKERNLIKAGEIVVIVAGVVEGVPGSTNMMKVEIVD